MASGCDSQTLLSHAIDFIRWLFEYASAVNLCSLVLDRHIAVAKPLKYLTFMKRRRVIQMMLISWAVPVTFIVIASSVWFNLKTHLAISAIGWLRLVLELPLCAVAIFCFASMLRVVWKHERSARTLAKQLRFNHQVFFKTQEKTAVKMMAIVVGLFLFCYGLFLRCSFVYILNDHKPCNDLEYTIPIVVLNSAVNPSVYPVFKRDVKNEFKDYCLSVTNFSNDKLKKKIGIN